MDTMNQNPNTTKQAEGGHSRAAAGSDYECGDEVTIEGHGTRTVNAQIGEYLFLDTDTDGPFIDAVHVSFVHNAPCSATRSVGSNAEDIHEERNERS